MPRLASWLSVPSTSSRYVGCVELCLLNTSELVFVSYLRERGYVMPGVCLSVCLLTTLHKNYWTDLHQNSTTNVALNNKVPIEFWKSSGSGVCQILTLDPDQILLGGGMRSVTGLVSVVVTKLGTHWIHLKTWTRVISRVAVFEACELHETYWYWL